MDLGPAQAREEKTERTASEEVFPSRPRSHACVPQEAALGLAVTDTEAQLSLFGKSALNPRLFFHCEDSASHEETSHREPAADTARLYICTPCHVTGSITIYAIVVM